MAFEASKAVHLGRLASVCLSGLHHAVGARQLTRKVCRSPTADSRRCLVSGTIMAASARTSSCRKALCSDATF